MIKIIEYFINNKRLNYMMLVFLAYLGYNAYINIPKEIFPNVELDKITITGGYSGASATNMDKMVVRDVESAISNISGVEKTETVITPGAFSILLTLDESVDKINALNKVKDAISTTRQYLPSDMQEPTATLVDRTRPLIRLAISSEKLNQGELTLLAQELKTKISAMKDISEISIRGDSDEEVSIEINSDALMAYGLNPTSVVSAISTLSYIFPVGDIEQRGNFVFVSTVSGKADAKEYENSVIKVDGVNIRLGDIAKVQVYYPQTKTLSTFNSKKAITLVISKTEEGNAIKLSSQLREYVAALEKNYSDVSFNLYQDSSKIVSQRLDTVTSNLMFGLVLVFLSMYILINLRIAFIVAIGIPFSFIIGLLFIYYMGYSINIVSLLGALIVIGIVVDDAIVVSENIQRHIDEGMEPKAASIAGVKEMLLPVSLATVTTVAAFLPMFMMKGEIALFLILIPIVVCMILIGSLLESFLFLPLHAEEALKKSQNLIDWTPLQNLYEKILHKLIVHKKLSLLLFLILIPLLTVFTAKSMKFQFFPAFDGEYLYITGQLDINTPIEDTFEITKEIEAEMKKHAEEFSIKSITSTSGWRRSLAGEGQTGNNVFYITIEMYDRKETNFINKYLNPILNFSFDFEQANKKRDKRSFELAPRAQEIIAPFKEKYKMQELGIAERKPGLIRSDIQVNLSGSNDAVLAKGIKKLEDEIKKIDGVLNYSDNIRYGKMEYKIKVNSYGERLGLSEAYVARTLSAYFLQKKQSTTFNDRGVVEIKTQDIAKDNSRSLLDFNLPLGDGRYVKLSEVVEIQKIRDYEKIDKLDGNIVKTAFANLDKRIVTATEVLQILEPTLDELASSGIVVNLLGEKEKNKQLQSEMKNAFILAIFLILLTLLLIFSKLKYAFMVISVIPLSILGALLGHKLIGMNLTMPSIIGILGLAGVVINDAIIMLDFLHGTHKPKEFFYRAKLRLRPIVITSLTTFLGLFTLIFYASGQAVILQPIAISLGFGLMWGTLLNLFYLPTLYGVVNSIDPNELVEHEVQSTPN